ncbi:Ferritin, chloroplastic-like protein, partial [Drosera capensis]
VTGSSWASVLERRSSLNFPADLYLRDSDQHCGWFQSSLLMSIAATAGCSKQENSSLSIIDGRRMLFSSSERLRMQKNEGRVNTQFFKESSDEEREQVEKLMKYQNTRGGRVKLHSVTMELALSLEKLVNEKLLKLQELGDVWLCFDRAMAPKKSK